MIPMKKLSNQHKLTLRSDTVRHLITLRDLSLVAGGLPTDGRSIDGICLQSDFGGCTTISVCRCGTGAD